MHFQEVTKKNREALTGVRDSNKFAWFKFGVALLHARFTPLTSTEGSITNSWNEALRLHAHHELSPSHPHRVYIDADPVWEGVVPGW